MSNQDSWTECIFIRVADDTKMRGAVSTLEGRAFLQSNCVLSDPVFCQKASRLSFLYYWLRRSVCGVFFTDYWKPVTIKAMSLELYLVKRFWLRMPNLSFLSALMCVGNP